MTKLTVAYSWVWKPRLVLDCIRINPHLHFLKTFSLIDFSYVDDRYMSNPSEFCCEGNSYHGNKFLDVNHVIGTWDPEEVERTWREIGAVNKVIKSHVNILKNTVSMLPKLMRLVNAKLFVCFGFGLRWCLRPDIL
jgi:hypothetical protein